MKYVSSYATIRKKYVIEISVFVISVPKIIDINMQEKESNTGCRYRQGYLALG
jgi:hypothetical protein